MADSVYEEVLAGLGLTNEQVDQMIVEPAPMQIEAPTAIPSQVPQSQPVQRTEDFDSIIKSVENKYGVSVQESDNDLLVEAPSAEVFGILDKEKMNREDLADRFMSEAMDSMIIESSMMDSSRKGKGWIKRDLSARFPELNDEAITGMVDNVMPTMRQAMEFYRDGDADVINRVPKEKRELFTNLVGEMAQRRVFEKDKNWDEGILSKMSRAFQIGSATSTGSMFDAFNEYILPLLPASIQKSNKDSFEKAKLFSDVAKLRAAGRKPERNNLVEAMILATTQTMPAMIPAMAFPNPVSQGGYWAMQMGPDALDEMRQMGVGEEIAKPLSLHILSII